MLHTIIRHTPFTLLVISMLFSGILTVATAETGTTTTSASTRTEVQTRPGNTVPPLNKKNTEAMDAKRKAFQERAAQMRANAGERKGTITAGMRGTTTVGVKGRANISEKIETRVRGAIANMKSRIAAAITKLASIADRVEMRAKKLQDQSINVDAALALIATARVEIRAAGVIINEDLSAEVDTAVTDTEPKAAFEYVKQSIREAHDHIKAAQKALREAVAALKLGVKTRRPVAAPATTTAP